MIVLAFNWQLARKCQFQLHDIKRMENIVRNAIICNLQIPDQKVPNSGKNEQITNNFDNLINEMLFS